MPNLVAPCQTVRAIQSLKNFFAPLGPPLGLTSGRPCKNFFRHLFWLQEHMNVIRALEAACAAYASLNLLLLHCITLHSVSNRISICREQKFATHTGAFPISGVDVVKGN